MPAYEKAIDSLIVQLATNVRNHIDNEGISEAQFVEVCNRMRRDGIEAISAKTLNNITNQRRSVNLRQLIPIAKAIECEPWQLLLPQKHPQLPPTCASMKQKK